MDLTAWLLRVAAGRPHVLVVAVPGETGLRLAVEAQIARRGWPSADSPADADLLVVAGTTGPELSAVVETVWSQLPAPRHRVSVTSEAGLSRALDAGERHLAEAAVQRRAPEQPERARGRESAAGPDAGEQLPGGIPMADLGEDRDGLMLDALHVPLGPVLPDWPAGLVVRTVLQGDVIRAAEAEVLDSCGGGSSFWARPGARPGGDGSVTVGEIARRAAAGQLDGLARFLGVAGWADPAARARRLRDALLADDPAADIRPSAGDLVERVGRSRTLRWLVRGIRAGDSDVAGRLAARLTALWGSLELLDVTSAADAADLRPSFPDRRAVTPADLAAALVGAEYAAARLVVAVLDLDPDLYAPAREASRRGPG